MITILSDISVAIILLLPLIIARLRIINLKDFAYSEGLARFSGGLIFLNFFLIKFSIDFGNTFWMVLFWQFLLIYPICGGAIYYISLIEKGQNSQQIFYIGLKRKQKIILALIIVTSFLTIIFEINENNQRVLDTHNQFINGLVDSENPMETLVYNTITPNTLLEILPNIQDIKEGEVTVSSLPWRSTIKVTTKKVNEVFTREFTYVRFYREWILDGIYNSSGSY